MAPSLIKSVDKTEVNLGETVTYSFDFFNDNIFDVILFEIEDSRIGIIEVSENVPPYTNIIISREVVMNEIGIITNIARAHYWNPQNEQDYYTDWSNEISVNVKSPSLQKTLIGNLVNTKAQAINEIGAVAGLISFETIISTELASETKLMKEVFA